MSEFTPQSFSNDQEAHAPVAQESQRQNPEVSPMGGRIMRAASRINALLERRAINKEHGQALQMNETRNALIARREIWDSAHEEALLMDDTETAAAGERARTAAINRDHVVALKMHKNYNRQKNAERRAEQIDAAKQRMADFGRSVGKGLETAGLIAIGIPLIGAEFAARKTREAVVATKSKAQEIAQAAEAKRNERKAQRDAAKEKRATDKAAREKARQDTAERKAAERRAEAAKRAQEAEARRTARREKWNSLKSAGRDKLTGAKTAIAERADRARNYSTEKRQQLGKFAERARLTARAAIDAGKDTWNNYGKESADTEEALVS